MKLIKNIFFDKRPLVNVVRLQGIISSSSRFPGSNNISLENLEKPLERAFSSKKVSGVALVINSPGGSPVQCSLISARINQLSKKFNVPVYSFIEDIAASGGYWLACSGDKIYVMPSSIIGSIGVISSGFGFVEIIKKIGIERRVILKEKIREYWTLSNLKMKRILILLQNYKKKYTVILKTGCVKGEEKNLMILLLIERGYSKQKFFQEQMLVNLA